MVLPSVMQAANHPNYSMDSGAAGQLAISAAGTLAYMAGGWVQDFQNSVVWIDRNGRQLAVLPIPRKGYDVVRLSPDEQRVAVMTAQSDSRIWVHTLGQQDSLVPITPASLRAGFPLWTPDGERVVFVGYTNGRSALYMARADGSDIDNPEPLGISHALAVYPASWTGDGRLVYLRTQPDANIDIWMAFRDGATWRDQEVVGGSSVEMWAQMSPDKRWLAHTSSEGATRYIRIRSWPVGGQLITIPAAGSLASPAWSRTPGELFYHRGSGVGAELVAHRVGPDGTVAQAGRPLFRTAPLRLVFCMPVPGFDVAKDGRFLFSQGPDEPPRPLPRDIRIVVNWFQELKDKVPIK